MVDLVGIQSAGASWEPVDVSTSTVTPPARQDSQLTVHLSLPLPGKIANAMDTSPVMAPARQDSQCQIYGTKMVLFGGALVDSSLSAELWTLDLEVAIRVRVRVRLWTLDLEVVLCEAGRALLMQ